MFSSVKTRERVLPRALRLHEGASIKEIAKRVGVSTSSVSTWVRDIELTLEQHDALRLRNPIYNGQLSGCAIASANRCAERVANQQQGRGLARRGERVGHLPHGTCRVVVSRTSVVQSIFGAIQEIGGFTRDAWLE